MRPIKGLPNPDAPVVDLVSGRMRQEWYARFSDLVAALLNRIPITGTVTFAAATTAAVTFDTPEADANYKIFYSSGADNYFWTTSPTTTGFTANAKTSTSATVGWQLIRA